MKNNPFRKRTGILPSYFTGRENELNELKKTYNSTKMGVPGHLILWAKSYWKNIFITKISRGNN